MTKDILNTIPTENDRIDFKSICKALTLLRQSRKVLASPYSLKDEVDGIIGLITKLSEGRPPRDQDLALLSPLAKMMLKRCEDAYNIMVPNADKSVKNPFGALQKLSGAEAIQHTFEMTKANMNSRASTMTLEDLKPLNQFHWVLTSTQRTPALGVAQDHRLCGLRCWRCEESFARQGLRQGVEPRVDRRQLIEPLLRQQRIERLVGPRWGHPHQEDRHRDGEEALGQERRLDVFQNQKSPSY